MKQQYSAFYDKALTDFLVIKRHVVLNHFNFFFYFFVLNMDTFKLTFRQMRSNDAHWREW